MATTERGRICEPDPREVDGAAASEVCRQRDQNAGHITVGTVMDEHDHRVSLTEGGVADDQDPDSSAALGVVDDVAASYHVESNSANAAASSPVSAACQAAAAAM